MDDTRRPETARDPCPRVPRLRPRRQRGPDARPVDVMPIPVEPSPGSRTGCPRPRASANGTSCATASSASRPLRAPGAQLDERLQDGDRRGGRRSFQSARDVYFNGGMDGLNCVVPGASADFAAYRTARPTLYRDLKMVVAGRVGSAAALGTSGQLAFANPVSAPETTATRRGSTRSGVTARGASAPISVPTGMHFLPATGSQFEATTTSSPATSVAWERAGWGGRSSSGPPDPCRRSRSARRSGSRSRPRSRPSARSRRCSGTSVLRQRGGSGTTSTTRSAGSLPFPRRPQACNRAGPSSRRP